MIREGKLIYTADGKVYERRPKKKQVMKKLVNEIAFCSWKKGLIRDAGRIAELDKEISRLKRQLNSVKNQTIEHKVKISTKKYKKDVLKKLILDSIEKETNKEITVEDYAYKFKAKTGDVYSIFQELIREGVIGHKRTYYAHDTNRNPMFYGSISGWASNYYTIKDKNGPC